MTDCFLQYFQTRQLNLRCFPTCDVHHFEKTFCGNNVKLTVSNCILNENSFVFGEFLLASQSRSFSIGDAVSLPQLVPEQESRWMIGKMIEILNQTERRFLIAPPARRWPCDLPRNSSAVFTVYLVLNDFVVQVLESPRFVLFSKRHKMILATGESTRQSAQSAQDKEEEEEEEDTFAEATSTHVHATNLVEQHQFVDTSSWMPQQQQQQQQVVCPPLPPLHLMFPMYVQSLRDFPAVTSMPIPTTHAMLHQPPPPPSERQDEN